MEMGEKAWVEVRYRYRVQGEGKQTVEQQRQVPSTPVGGPLTCVNAMKPPLATARTYSTRMREVHTWTVGD